MQDAKSQVLSLAGCYRCRYTSKRPLMLPLSQLRWTRLDVIGLGPLHVNNKN